MTTNQHHGGPGYAKPEPSTNTVVLRWAAGIYMIVFGTLAILSYGVSLNYFRHMENAELLLFAAMVSCISGIVVTGSAALVLAEVADHLRARPVQGNGGSHQYGRGVEQEGTGD